MSICSIIFTKCYLNINIRSYIKMQITAKTLTKSTKEFGRKVVELLTGCG